MMPLLPAMMRQLKISCMFMEKTDPIDEALGTAVLDKITRDGISHFIVVFFTQEPCRNASNPFMNKDQPA